MTGKTEAERCYLFGLVKGSKVVRPGKKCSFLYRLGSVPVCRSGFCVLLGLSANNSRIKQYEAMVRRGVQTIARVETKVMLDTASRGHKCLQFVRAFILDHAERSPAAAVLESDRPSLAGMYALYIKE